MNWDLLLTFTKICVPGHSGCEIWLPMFCIIMSVGGLAIPTNTPSSRLEAFI